MIKAKGELSIFGPCLPYFKELASSIRRKVGDLEGIDNLNHVGVRIWELIDGKRQVQEIRDLIVAEFEVSQEKAEKVLLTLLQQFTEIGAINEVPVDGV